MISYAQNFEDVMLARVLADVPLGSYVDVGAHDPVIDSVTNHFYQLGWSGINLEPQKSMFEKLMLARPRDINIEACVGSFDGEVEFASVTNRTGWSSGSMEQKRVLLENPDLNVSLQVCKQYTLNSVLSNNPLNEIHFMKIDVEGGELEVIEGIDFNEFKPWILVIEATQPGTQNPNYESWEQILLSAEYFFVYSDGLNRFYLSKDHLSLKEKFKFPPNAFDEFETQYASLAKQERDQAKIESHELAMKVAELNAHMAALGEIKTQHEKEIVVLRKDIDLLHSTIFEIKKSLSWRITKPLRALGSLLVRH
jgi:FkbM family methyltransferase